MRLEPLARACVIAARWRLRACGGDAEPTAEPAAGHAGADRGAAPPRPPPPAAGSDGSSPAINSVTVDPGDGTIMVGSGPALYRLEPGAKEAERLTGRSTTRGQAPSRATSSCASPGPGDLLASGHPQDGALPENLGADPLQRPRRDWQSVPGPEADYHELEIAGNLILARQRRVARHPGRQRRRRDVGDAHAARGADRRRRRSRRPAAVGGLDRAGHVRLHQRRPVLAPARHDVRRAAGLAEADALYSVDRNGKVRVSADGGGAGRTAARSADCRARSRRRTKR